MMALSTRNDDPKTASRPFDKEDLNQAAVSGMMLALNSLRQRAWKKQINIINSF